MLTVRDYVDAVWAWLESLCTDRHGALGSSIARLHELGRRACNMARQSRVQMSDHRSKAHRGFCEAARELIRIFSAAASTACRRFDFFCLCEIAEEGAILVGILTDAGGSLARSEAIEGRRKY